METHSRDAIWNETLTLIAGRVNEGTFRIWFAQTAGLGFVDGAFVVGVSSDFAKDWIETRFQALIQDALSEVMGDTMSCRLVVDPSVGAGDVEKGGDTVPRRPAGEHEDERADAFAGGARTEPGAVAQPDPGGRTQTTPPGGELPLPVPPPVAVPGNGKPATAVGIGLSDKYTFESFIIGPSNRFAHAAALAVAESPGDAYNPLFVYGGVGLGKTHLLQAIGHYVLHHATGLRVRFVTAEMFTNDFINSVRENKMEDFKRRFRTNDVLLIDDIQFLQHKEGTQEEFFHTFYTLQSEGKQIVISSDRPPKELNALEERLVSRFEQGLTVDIQPPTLETRIAILRKKVKTDRIRVADDEVLMLIASRAPSNIRELEGYLTRVVAAGSFSGRAVDVSLAREVLRDIPETAVTRITMDHILAAVSTTLGIPVSDIKGDKRSRNIVQARHVAMYLARELTDLSLPKIGERIGGRDHTTVLHAVGKVGRLILEDRQMYDLVQQLTTKIKTAR